MHLIHRSKVQAPRDFIPTQSQWAIPGHRKVRNRRYNAKGEFIGYSRPKPTIHPGVQAKVRKAIREGAEKGLPPPEVPFDMATYHPLPTKVLLSRGPLITHEKGIAIPEDKQRHEPYWVVIKIGANVTSCAVGDHAICGRGWRPKECYLGKKYYMAYQEAIVGVLQPVL